MNDNDEYNIDDKWLRDYKEQEKKYKLFYKEKPTSIKMYFIYVNKHNVVEYLKNDTYLLHLTSHAQAQTILPKNDLISIIKNNMYSNGNKYKLVSLLKYNVDIEPEEIIHMTMDKRDATEYLSAEKELRDIVFNDTICILQDINSLFFVFQERLIISVSVSESNSISVSESNVTSNSIGVSVSNVTSNSISESVSNVTSNFISVSNSIGVSNSISESNSISVSNTTPHNKSHKNIKKVFISQPNKSHQNNKTKKNVIRGMVMKKC